MKGKFTDSPRNGSSFQRAVRKFTKECLESPLDDNIDFAAIKVDGSTVKIPAKLIEDVEALKHGEGLEDFIQNSLDLGLFCEGLIDKLSDAGIEIGKDTIGKIRILPIGSGSSSNAEIIIDFNPDKLRETTKKLNDYADQAVREKAAINADDMISRIQNRILQANLLELSKPERPMGQDKDILTEYLKGVIEASGAKVDSVRFSDSKYGKAPDKNDLGNLSVVPMNLFSKVTEVEYTVTSPSFDFIKLIDKLRASFGKESVPPSLMEDFDSEFDIGSRHKFELRGNYSALTRMIKNNDPENFPKGYENQHE